MLREFKIKINGRGFTLVEMIISATIFALIIGAAFTVFISISRLQRKTITAQRLAGEGRYLMEQMARTIREGRISYFDPLNNPITYTTPSNFVYVDNLSGNRIKFYQDANSLKREIFDSTPPSVVDILSSANIKIQSLNFYIKPNIQSSTQKPIVLITMSMENVEIDASIKDIIHLQTAVESRYY